MCGVTLYVTRHRKSQESLQSHMTSYLVLFKDYITYIKKNIYYKTQNNKYFSEIILFSCGFRPKVGRARLSNHFLK